MNVLFTSLQKVPLPDAFIAAVYVTEIIIISYLLSFWSFVFIFLNHLNQWFPNSKLLNWSPHETDLWSPRPTSRQCPTFCSLQDRHFPKVWLLSSGFKKTEIQGDYLTGWSQNKGNDFPFLVNLQWCRKENMTLSDRSIIGTAKLNIVKRIYHGQ